MRKFLMVLAAVGVGAAAPTITPAIADAPGFWTFGSNNGVVGDKVCSSLDVQIRQKQKIDAHLLIDDEGERVAVDAATRVVVTVTNADQTSETFVFNLRRPASVAIFKALQDACEHADDNAARSKPYKSYSISVSGAGPGVRAIFGGLVGNLPASGAANAGGRGFITRVIVQTNNG